MYRNGRHPVTPEVDVDFNGGRTIHDAVKAIPRYLCVLCKYPRVTCKGRVSNGPAFITRRVEEGRSDFRFSVAMAILSSCHLSTA